MSQTEQGEIKSLLEPEPLYISSMVDLLIVFMVSLAGLIINWKFLRDMNEDDQRRPAGTNECLIKDVLSTITTVMMVSMPIYLFLFWFLNEKYKLPAWFQYLLCYDQYISATFRVYWGFNSLVIAAMRSTFIVHNTRVLHFGKERAKSAFYYGSVIIPIVLGVLHALSVQTPTNIQNLAQSVCIEFYLDSLNITREDSQNIPGFGSPILSFVHQYVPSDVTDYVYTALVGIWLVIFSNVLEGILYWRTFAEIRR